MSILSRACAKAYAIGPRKMRRRFEAARHTYRGDGHIGLLKQLSRANKAQPEIEMRRRILERGTKEPFQLTPRHPDFFRECIGRKRFLHVLFHEPDHLDQLAVMDAVASGD